MITCTILTYNEETRIRTSLAHALKWADEVLVLDKGSTDRTREIAGAMGARVEIIPFTPPGGESATGCAALATHDWIAGFTAGEVPTRKLIETVRHHLSGEPAFAVLLLPIVIHSFGIFDPAGPWAGGFQPRVFDRSRARLRDHVHSSFDLDPATTLAVPLAEDCYVLHQTHATAAGFMHSHASYAALQADIDPAAALLEARRHLSVKTGCPMHAHAWALYWHAVALHALERLAPSDVTSEYAARAAELIEQEWP